MCRDLRSKLGSSQNKKQLTSWLTTCVAVGINVILWDTADIATVKSQYYHGQSVPKMYIPPNTVYMALPQLTNKSHLNYFFLLITNSPKSVFRSCG